MKLNLDKNKNYYIITDDATVHISVETAHVLNNLLEELELHYERGMMFSHQQTLDKIQAMKRKYPFLNN